MKNNLFFKRTNSYPNLPGKFYGCEFYFNIEDYDYIGNYISALGYDYSSVFWYKKLGEKFPGKIEYRFYYISG